ncbi:unnamed protein product [Amaranthus hypochondriacus]
MAGRNGAFVPVVAILFGALAVLFSFIAYAKRIKAEDVSANVDDGSCVYRRSPASVLSVFAAIFLLTAQIIISVAANCFCCCGVRCVSRCTTITSLILFVLSWVTFFLAFLGFVATAILNSSNYLSSKHSTTNNDGLELVQNCYIGKGTFFLSAAIWCIITLILSLSSYAISACTSEAQHRNVHLQGTAGYDVGVAMGQPHMSHMQMSKDQC